MAQDNDGREPFRRADNDRRAASSPRDIRSHGYRSRQNPRSGMYSGTDSRAAANGDRNQPRERRPDRARRAHEPALPDDAQASDLDPAIRRDLRSLDRVSAEAVARHLVMAAQLAGEDPHKALAHARAARERAARIAVVRETAGIAAYHAGEWSEALAELRTARRLAGGTGLLAMMADCERGLGRPERAIELARSEPARALTGDDATEMLIVVAGARMDLGEFDQAVATLQTADLDATRIGSAAARLFYAYAEALLAADRSDEAMTWFLNATAADLDGETDAEDRVAELAVAISSANATGDAEAT